MAWRTAFLLTAMIAASAAQAGLIARLDLPGSSQSRTRWTFSVEQGAPGQNVVGDPEPGKLHLCLSPDGGRTCRPDLDTMLHVQGDDEFSDAHYLRQARIVHPDPAHSLLLVQVASIYSVDGDQRIATHVLEHAETDDSFATIYAIQPGRNNDQEVRFVETGPLKGAIISAVPTANAPFGFWVTVNRFVPERPYRQVLRYRSATHYGDGNPLAVIDSEMPNILRRLGSWHPGRPLPLPANGCARPRLVRMELWCA